MTTLLYSNYGNVDKNIAESIEFTRSRIEKFRAMGKPDRAEKWERWHEMWLEMGRKRHLI